MMESLKVQVNALFDQLDNLRTQQRLRNLELFEQRQVFVWAMMGIMGIGIAHRHCPCTLTGEQAQNLAAGYLKLLDAFGICDCDIAKGLGYTREVLQQVASGNPPDSNTLGDGCLLDPGSFMDFVQMKLTDELRRKKPIKIIGQGLGFQS